MKLLRRWPWRDRLAVQAVLCSAMFALWEAFQALTLRPLPQAQDVPGDSMVFSLPAAESFGDGTTILTAVSRNPFRPDRRRALGRLADTSAMDPEPAEAQPVPHFELSGVASAGGETTVILIRADRGPPRLLSPGDSISGFRFAQRRGRKVLLVRADTSVTLQLADPLLTSAAPQ